MLVTSWNLLRACRILLNNPNMLKRICGHLCQDSACKVDCQEYGHAENTLLCPWYLWLQAQFANGCRSASCWAGLQLSKQVSICSLVVVRYGYFQAALRDGSGSRTWMHSQDLGSAAIPNHQTSVVSQASTTPWQADSDSQMCLRACPKTREVNFQVVNIRAYACNIMQP